MAPDLGPGGAAHMAQLHPRLSGSREHFLGVPRRPTSSSRGCSFQSSSGGATGTAPEEPWRMPRPRPLRPLL